jgi:hypothetical protein
MDERGRTGYLDTLRWVNSTASSKSLNNLYLFYPQRDGAVGSEPCGTQ